MSVSRPEHAGEDLRPAHRLRRSDSAISHCNRYCNAVRPPMDLRGRTRTSRPCHQRKWHARGRRRTVRPELGVQGSQVQILSARQRKRSPEAGRPTRAARLPRQYSNRYSNALEYSNASAARAGRRDRQCAAPVRRLDVATVGRRDRGVDRARGRRGTARRPRTGRRTAPAGRLLSRGRTHRPDRWVPVSGRG